MGKLSSVFEETDVPQFQDGSSPHFPLWYLQILARPHGKIKGSNGQLGDGPLRLSDLQFGHHSQHSNWESFLLDWIGVLVFEGSEEP